MLKLLKKSYADFLFFYKIFYTCYKIYLLKKHKIKL